MGIDIGGTKVAAGVVDENGNVLARARRRTPTRDPAHLVDVVGEIVRQMLAEHEVTCIGVGAAGWVDVARKTVLFAPNLAWRDTPLREQIAEKDDLPVVVENDANAAAWGEYRFGAGVGAKDVIVVTIGTGIGCGIVIDERLYRGAFGIAGEPGHMRVVPGGRLCGCGNHGCWEQYCSGTALVRAAHEIVAQRPQEGQRLRQIAGDSDAIDGPAVMRAAQEGDPAAVDCFQEVGRWLGQGLADLAAILDPDRFVVGGGVGDADELLPRPGWGGGGGWPPETSCCPARRGTRSRRCCPAAGTGRPPTSFGPSSAAR